MSFPSDTKRAMAVYSAVQLDQYFKHIGYTQSSPFIASIKSLTDILKHQLTTVPFESLSLHYSTTRTISLDPQDLFDKIVVGRRGGYCLENNTFFKSVLQSLGFQVISVVCRIGNASRGILDGGWRGMSHMANIVKIRDVRFLIDVGFGVDGPSLPVPLVAGKEIEGLPNQLLKLEYKSLAQHNDSDQRVWIYSQCRELDEWSEIYNFADAEMFPADFDILNYYNMSSSSFTHSIVVQRFVSDDTSPQIRLSGTLLLVRDILKSRNNQGQEIVETLKTEEGRMVVLKKYFGIELNVEQRSAIHGRNSELRAEPI